MTINKYSLSEVTPEMVGGINYWAKALGMGGANIRVAIRNKTLHAELAPLNESNPKLLSYRITGQDILDWRTVNRTGPKNGAVKVGHVRDTFKYRTSEAITTEVVDHANAILHDAGFTFSLIRPQPKDKALVISEPAIEVVDEPEDMSTEELQPTDEPQSAKSGGFNLFGRK